MCYSPMRLASKAGKPYRIFECSQKLRFHYEDTQKEVYTSCLAMMRWWFFVHTFRKLSSLFYSSSSQSKSILRWNKLRCRLIQPLSPSLSLFRLPPVLRFPSRTSLAMLMQWTYFFANYVSMCEPCLNHNTNHIQCFQRWLTMNINLKQFLSAGMPTCAVILILWCIHAAWNTQHENKTLLNNMVTKLYTVHCYIFSYHLKQETHQSQCQYRCWWIVRVRACHLFWYQSCNIERQEDNTENCPLVFIYFSHWVEDRSQRNNTYRFRVIVTNTTLCCLSCNKFHSIRNPPT